MGASSDAGRGLRHRVVRAHSVDQSRFRDPAGYFLATRMRSKSGLVATMVMGSEKTRGYTEGECDYISTIAQLASHALSA